MWRGRERSCIIFQPDFLSSHENKDIFPRSNIQCPSSGAYRSVSIEINGRSHASDQPFTTLVGVAELGFFETLDIPLLRSYAPTEEVFPPSGHGLPLSVSSPEGGKH